MVIAGHTEAAVDISRLAGLNPSAPPCIGTTNFLVDKLIVEPPGVIVEPSDAVSNEADGCCFSLLKLNAALLFAEPLVLGIGLKKL